MTRPATPRDTNRLRILDTLRREGRASRGELARMTGLSRSTVAGLVAELTRQGLVVDGGEPEEVGAALAGPGRPPVLLCLGAAAGTAVGIDFGHGHVRVAVADLSSKVLAERAVDLDVDHEAAHALDVGAELVTQVLAEARVERGTILGAGVGVPAPIDRATGTLRSSSIIPGWAGLHLAGELGSRLGMPVAIENDANLGALAEVSFGAGRGLEDVVYVRCERGIGAGLFLGGALYRGSSGLAGELGHVQVRAEGAVCRCGNRGCLETVAATGALLAALEPAHGHDIGVPRLRELVEAGDPGAARVVNDAGRAVGRVLADLVNHLNPAAIIVGGALVGLAAEPLLQGIRDTVDRYAQPGTAEAVDVRPGVLGERAEVLGALALVIRDTERIGSGTLVSLAREAAPALAGGR